MEPLDRSLRNQLERTVIKARRVADQAARAMLGGLGVEAPEPDKRLAESDRDLRRRLRIHGRQLGDRRKPEGDQEIHWLAREVAYEHWHRMLFARFLAENDLLMYPDPDDPVAITLEECEELAPDEGAADGWELAARYAARMLPQIFRNDSPVFELRLPPEHQRNLEKLLAELPTEVFSAADALGWVYQFWQSENKERINQSEVKIGARELPAVTQLFTEPYMVSFLLDNSLGAWWAARRLSEHDLKNAESEEELRGKAAIPGVPLAYLRFVQQEDGTWTPAAGTFDAWPHSLADLKTLDPCCGSGHFLVAALMMLVPMRMEREGLDARDAVDAVLRDNLHGLELDQRCVELAAFALALTAWNYPGAGGYRVLPELNLACSGLSVSVAKEEWKQLGLGKRNLGIALDWMHDNFRDAPVLGSLLNPARTDAAKVVEWRELSATLEKALEKEQPDEQQEAAVVAQGLAKAATLLSGGYQWVITNVPYLARGKQNDRLRDFCEKYYPAAKNDLATVFLDRCLEFCVQNGTTSVVLPQNWLFLSRYRKFREKLLKNETWHLIARLGHGAFETISGEVVKAILINLSRGNNAKDSIELFGDSENASLIHGVDVSETTTAIEKASQLLVGKVKSVEQEKQLQNPDNRVLLEQGTGDDALNQFSDSRYGLRTGDGARLIAKYWEISWTEGAWEPHQSTVQQTVFYAGREHCVYWEGGKGGLSELAELGIASLQGADAWGNMGVAVSLTGELRSTLYCGNKYDNNCAAIWPIDSNNLPAIWAYCSSVSYNTAVRD